MKRCPQCKRIERDDALVYCRADGTALISESGAVADDDAVHDLGLFVALDHECSPGFFDGFVMVRVTG